MEIETIEEILQNLGLESSIDLFRQQKLDLDLLQRLSEHELKDIFIEIKIPIGDRINIITKIKEIRDNGK